MKRKIPSILKLEWKTKWEKPLYRGDSLLGYSLIPGVHHISQSREKSFINIKRQFKIILDEDGYRTTSENVGKFIGMPGIWLYGCSQTFAWGLNNKDTFGWLLQEQINNFYVRNFGVPGYGNTHALLQLKQAVIKQKKAVIVVIVYNPFHLIRNIASPSRLREFHVLDESIRKKLMHPMAFVNTDGKLGVKLIPLKTVGGLDPDYNYMLNVTMMVFKEIYNLCSKNNIIPVLAFQSGTKDDPVVKYGLKIGFKIVDMSLESIDKYLLLPFDEHQNENAHKIYAEKLFSGLEVIIGEVLKKNATSLR